MRVDQLVVAAVVAAQEVAQQRNLAEWMAAAGVGSPEIVGETIAET